MERQDQFQHYFHWSRALDRGGMGQVFLGEHIPSQTPVVLKVPLPSQRHTFAVEMNAATQIDSPDVVTLYDQGTLAEPLRIDDHQIEQGTPYVVMAYVEGQPLEADVVAQMGTVWQVLLRVARAIASLHAVGVIHRDLKPKNILASPTCDALTIIDFGLSSSIERLEVVSSGGTMTTMAPEQLEPHAGLGHGPWTDIYAMACLAYRWLTGEYPFLGISRAEIWDAKMRGWTDAHASRVPPSWRLWFERALHPDPRMRWQSMAHAMGALAHSVEDERQVASDLVTGTLDDSLWLSSQTIQSQKLPEVVVKASPSEMTRQVDAHLLSMFCERQVAPQHMAGVGLGMFNWRKMPLIGRQEAQRQLVALLRQTHTERVLKCAVICGQAGIGKSALSQWLGQFAHLELGARTLSLTCDAQDELTTILRRGLSRWADVHEQMTPTSRRQRLFARFSQVALPQQHQSILWSMQAAQVKTPPSEVCLESFVVLLKHIAQHGQVVLRVEDPSLAQWQRIHAWLAQHCIHVPICCVVTQRVMTLDDTHLTDGIDLSLSLGALDQNAQRQLLGHLLALVPSVEQEILSRTDGNPLFTVRLLHDWVDRQLLQPSVSGFGLPDDVSLDVPADLMTLCLNRFEALLEAPQLARCLCTLATLGRTMTDEEVIATAAHFQISHIEMLSALQHRQLVEAVHEGWRLTHNMLHESLLKWRDTHLSVASTHESCVSILRQLGHQNASAWRRLTHHELAAQHMMEGLEVAGRYLAAIDVHAARQWISDFEQRHAAHLTPPQQMMFSLIQVIPHQSQGQWSQVEQMVQALRPVAEQMNWSRLMRKILHIQTDNACNMHAFDEAEHHLATWIALLDEREHAQQLHSALRVEANMATNMGDIERALACLLRARTLVPDPSWDIAWTRYQLAGAYEALGQMDESMRQCDQAMAFFEQQDELSGMASCLAQMASVDLNFERFEQAQQRFEEATALYRQCGDGGQWLTMENALRAAFRHGTMITQRHLEQLRDIQRALDAGEGFASFVDDLMLLAIVSLAQWEALPTFLTRVEQMEIEPWMYDPVTFTPQFIEQAMDMLMRHGQMSWLSPLASWQSRLRASAEEGM